LEVAPNLASSAAAAPCKCQHGYYDLEGCSAPWRAASAPTIVVETSERLPFSPTRRCGWQAVGC
jgi:hypothetical protein